MKALTVKQPFASAIHAGYKTIEVRSWKTDYRGKLLITASKSPKDLVLKATNSSEVDLILPSGVMLCVVNLKDITEFTQKHANDGSSMVKYAPNYYAWHIEVISWVEPKQVVGKVKLFEVDDTLITLV